MSRVLVFVFVFNILFSAFFITSQIPKGIMIDFIEEFTGATEEKNVFYEKGKNL